MSARMGRLLSLRRRCACPVAAGLDRLDGVPEGLSEDALAEDAEHASDHAPLEVLALADDVDVDVGRSVGVASERVEEAGVSSPGVGDGGRELDVRGDGP